ncbi:hypothetical protein SLE2022_283190 [Rubroshorea leprosula]
MEYENQYRDVPEAKYECLLFDVDDTLYPLNSGLSKACATNILDFMVQRLGIEENKVSEINEVLYKNYGTSMAGLLAVGYKFDYDDYHSYVHGRLPYGNLKPDPVLRNLLQSLPIRKVVFSNGDQVHVNKVLKKLGLEDCFEMVITFEILNPTSTETPVVHNHPSGSEFPDTPIVCKPFENAFERAFKLANIDPQKTLFFDDSTRNIQTGKRMGLHTVLVGSSHRTNGADYALDSIHNMREALPELWEEADKRSESAMHHSGDIAIETTVQA